VNDDGGTSAGKLGGQRLTEPVGGAGDEHGLIADGAHGQIFQTAEHRRQINKVADQRELSRLSVLAIELQWPEEKWSTVR
jgi:hypothetical protein